MSIVSAKPSAISMRGGGYYSANTIGAKAVIDKAGDLVAEAVAQMERLDGPGPFAVADFGAADGGTSMDLMRRVVALVRERSPGRQVALTYTDLPHNDFSALFRLSQGLIGPRTETPLAATPGLFISAAGTSFYRQILPDASLDLGFSATAMHWLSAKPGEIAAHVHAVGAGPQERRAFAAQAAEDWTTILLNRARELKAGGKLVLANFCIDEEGRYLGHTGGVDMFDTFARLWRDLAEAGRITPEELRRATFQQFYRTPDEFAAPFRDPASAVVRAGLRLDRILTTVTPCPYAQEFARTGDAAAFARAYVPTLRSWSETVFAGALDPARPAEDRLGIVDAFYGAYEAEVARRPAGHGMDYVHCFMTVTKQQAAPA